MTNRRWFGTPCLTGSLLALGLWLGVPSPGAAQEAGQALPPLLVETDLPDDGWIESDRAVAIRLDRSLAEGERLAVFVGATDFTDLFRIGDDGRRLTYAPRAVRFPAGERELIVYRLDEAGSWEELTRRPIRVRGALGMETLTFAPQVDLSVEGQLAEGHDPESAAPPRRTYQDVTGRLSLATDGARGDFRSSVQAAAIGVSHRPAALRFGELQADAPKWDLSDYLFEIQAGRTGFSQGHVSLGGQRHLISGFSSRGALLTARPTDRVDLALGAANGSSVVGWDNFLGLDDGDHRILSGSLGLEVLERPGGLRVELSGMDGSILPVSGFNQGAITDAEESRGFGAVVRAADPSGRVRFEGGFARSTFVNPDDPTLALGDVLVPVEEETRNARYLEASAAVLRGVALGGSRSLDLTLGWRHEKVDPLYRSLGAYAGADRLDHQFEAQAQVARIDLRGSLARSEDNLEDIPSILKTKTRRTGFGVGVPLPSLFAADASSGGAIWLPHLSWSFDRTHQFGDGLPVGGGFDPSHVPDQASVNHSVSANWSLAQWLSLGYRLNRSHQDNRQPGRENADFTNLSHGVTAGVRPLATLTFDVSLDLEAAEDHERDETEETWRMGFRTSWMPLDRSTLGFGVSRTVSEDEAATRRRASTLLDAQWSSFVPGLALVGGGYFLRFARALGETRDDVFDFDDRQETWTFSSGLSFSFSP